MRELWKLYKQKQSDLWHKEMYTIGVYVKQVSFTEAIHTLTGINQNLYLSKDS